MVIHRFPHRAASPLPGDITPEEALRRALSDPLSAANLFTQVNPPAVIRLLRDTLLTEGLLRPAREPLILSVNGVEGLLVAVDPEEAQPTEGVSDERLRAALEAMRWGRLQVGPITLQGMWEARKRAQLVKVVGNGVRLDMYEAEAQLEGGLVVLDGHHRREAAKALGVPVLAWVVPPGALKARPIHRIYPKGVRFPGKPVSSLEQAPGKPVFYDGRRFYALELVPSAPPLKYTPDLEEALENPPSVILPEIKLEPRKKLPHKALFFSPKPPAGAAMMVF